MITRYQTASSSYGIRLFNSAMRQPTEWMGRSGHLHIDMGTQHSVCAVLQVATQGDSALSKWTTSYKPEFSLDVATYNTNKENNVDKVSNCIF